MILPNVMDGPAQVTQDPIKNGGVYRYEFTATQSGTHFYHSHDHVDRQQALGLYGAMLIEPLVADPAHHTTNNNTETNGGGGLMMHIAVAGNQAGFDEKTGYIPTTKKPG